MAGDTILKRTAAAFTAVFLAASIFTGCGDKSDTSEDNTSAENNTSSSDEVSSADLVL
jgi:preprotein translocase subunit SecG